MAVKSDKDVTYVIKAPVEGYCGIGAAGVQFANGTGETKDPWVAAWFKERGYGVEEKS